MPTANNVRPIIRLKYVAYTLLPLIAALLLFSQPTLASTENSANDDSCYVDGLSDRLHCGYVTVPENYAKPDGKQIRVHYAVLPAIKPSFTKEALLAIAGGPGQSAIENAASFDHIFTKVRQQRDILLIDQRGTGQSNLLQCDNDAAVEAILSINENNVDIQAETQKCLDGIDADVTQYGSEIALKDFEAVRSHLGYQKLHVYGISYGTRMAQLYMRHYPQVLATVTLDGVVPMQQSVLHIGDAIDRAIDLLWQDCNDNSLCRQQFGELKQQFEQVNQQLQNGPIISQTRDPLTNEPTQLTMTQAKFMGAIRMALYSTNVRALIPHAIHQAAEGNFQAIMGLYALTVNSTGIAMGMHSSVVCGEDWQRLSEQQVQQAQQSYFAREMLKSFDITCPIWNMPVVDSKQFSAAIDSDIPTLVLSGQIDPATPPSWGELAMEKLSNAKHFIAPYATHGVAYQSCGNELIAQLVNSSSVEQLSETCLSNDVSRNFYLNANTVEQIAKPSDADNQSSTTQGATHD
ncbi:alpha/beta hydrolase [Shewanella sp. Isolate11]|uniref:alpha/beta hydrolase n=1 Tax=Shewanella sp. Isolate11 TaxID=2908530 RepID=UPI001EFE50D8|nr:alpha/beta hydrolase [Shewanella sp. Isolate11]MCG9698416.1 alpha/beta hydrolase [Shewanella sp. Isolate11]